ncbi:hypothetical protein ACTTAI_09410 [Rhodobacter capsulatus]|uniref:hypothetical protein n=1 Tax=Rhodobacter capsulatus TaxID=1061 RepID=UPI0040290E9B
MQGLPACGRAQPETCSGFKRIAPGGAGGPQATQPGSRLAQRHEQDEANRERIETGEVHVIPAFLWVPFVPAAQMWRKRGGDWEKRRQIRSGPGTALQKGLTEAAEACFLRPSRPDRVPA